MLIFLIYLTLFILTGCESLLHIKYTALPNPNNLLKDIRAKKIKIEPFIDEREKAEEADIAGAYKRKTYGQIYDIKSDREIAKVLKEAVTEELSRNGHQIVEENEDLIITGRIKTFWVSSIPTPNGDWNITAEVKFFIITKDPATGKETMTGPFYGKEIELRYIEPDARVFNRMIEKALAKAIMAMSSDPDFANTLK